MLFKYDHLISGISRTKLLTINEIMQVIIRHLEREARIRDLFITCLNIKEASENITNNAQVNPYWFDLALVLCIHHYFVAV